MVRGLAIGIFLCLKSQICVKFVTLCFKQLGQGFQDKPEYLIFIKFNRLVNRNNGPDYQPLSIEGIDKTIKKEQIMDSDKARKMMRIGRLVNNIITFISIEAIWTMITYAFCLLLIESASFG